MRKLASGVTVCRRVSSRKKSVNIKNFVHESSDPLVIINYGPLPDKIRSRLSATVSSPTIFYCYLASFNLINFGAR